MIPVRPEPEPENFELRVREPGFKFLREVPEPTGSQWKGREYWQRSLPNMRKAYRCICAYCAQWIPYGTGNHSVDHFLPKNEYPEIAYEWSNFRYVSSRFNARKGTNRILDPFQIKEGWFVLNFLSFLIRPESALPPDTKKAVLNTIRILRLNEDEDLVAERQSWFEDFRTGQISFSFLKKKRPFIAYELERQGFGAVMKGREAPE
ncbi:MAG TPA: hypothetical protein ENK58_04020 [Desulfobacterales bacterium]|nr:hypothetical protein [Desulfobacterales bacterium]